MILSIHRWNPDSRQKNSWYNSHYIPFPLIAAMLHPATTTRQDAKKHWQHWKVVTKTTKARDFEVLDGLYVQSDMYIILSPMKDSTTENG